MIRLRHTIALAALMAASVAAQADTVAIVHAKAWTLTTDTPVENATIVVTDGRIVAVKANAPAPTGARVIDAQGKAVTPGLMRAATQLGLIEVGAATETVDHSISSGPFGASFDIQYALNANSILIQQARADGLTRAVSFPGRSAVAPFAGSAALLRLSTSSDVLEQAGVGVFVTIGNASSKSAGGSRAASWQLLRRALDDAKTALAGPAKAPARTSDVMALEPVLSGKIPLVISTNRESDLRQAIKLASDYKLRVIINGGVEAWRVAAELAAARIPVIVDPQANLPASFDQIGARLDNASLLHRAGVTVVTNLFARGIHGNYNAGSSLREGAGLAVANGLPYVEGLRSIITYPARIWGLSDRYGTIAAGQDGDLVIWDGDPLEPSTLPTALLIGGNPVSLATRQTALSDRYLRKAGIIHQDPRP